MENEPAKSTENSVIYVLFSDFPRKMCLIGCVIIGIFLLEGWTCSTVNPSTGWRFSCKITQQGCEMCRSVELTVKSIRLQENAAVVDNKMTVRDAVNSG